MVLAEVEVEALVHECEAELVRLDGACYGHSSSGHAGHGRLSKRLGEADFEMGRVLSYVFNNVASPVNGFLDIQMGFNIQ